MPVLTGGVEAPEYPGDHFHYALTRILAAGRAHGLQVIDGPYLRIRDLDGLRAYCQRTRILGFDGKWTLHPDQVAIVNEAFSPTQEQYDRACAVLDALARSATDQGLGAVRFGDEMIDEASRKMAATVVAKGDRVGLSRSVGD
jgi:citrate lyase subunit beta/citryl-CoA lyase